MGDTPGGKDFSKSPEVSPLQQYRGSKLRLAIPPSQDSNGNAPVTFADRSAALSRFFLPLPVVRVPELPTTASASIFWSHFVSES
jgi:hypothetical protein